MDKFFDHILLGKVKVSNAPVWYPAAELPKHLLLLGRTGSGKTNFFYWVLSQLITKIPVWIFDRKEDYRHLHRVFPGRLLVIDLVRDFKCNPLAVPPYVQPKRWLDQFCELFCRINSLLDGSSGLLRTTLDRLYMDYGVYDGSGKCPSFFELLESLKRIRVPAYGRQSGFRDSLVNRVQAYLNHGELYDCSVGFDIERLMSKSVVFEITGMLEVQANFWLNFLLLYMFSDRIARKERGNQLRNVVCFDEAKSVFPPFVNANIGFKPITYMVSQLREFGVSIIAADQSADLDNSIFANSQFKMVMQLGSGDDIDKAAKALGLDRDQKDYIYSLDVGEAIVRHPKINQPFVMEIPRFPLE